MWRKATPLHTITPLIARSSPKMVTLSKYIPIHNSVHGPTYINLWTSTIAHTPGSQTHITTMYQTIFVFLRWTRASTNGNPPTRVGVLSHFLCRAQNHGIVTKSKIRIRGVANEEWLHIGKCPKPKIQTFWILDWEIWPVWMSFFSINLASLGYRRQSVSYTFCKHLMHWCLHFEGAGKKQPWNDS